MIQNDGMELQNNLVTIALSPTLEKPTNCRDVYSPGEKRPAEPEEFAALADAQEPAHAL